MDFIVIGEMIESLGFPIVVSVALFWSNRETVKNYSEIINQFRNTIHSNTVAMNRLIDKLDGK